ncbi:transketolase C-terminal domain-containing protein [Pelagicoccus enzymogenes]|uniref:transketolase family protein n=1 Tax=Pelagicoccus enzymogenes TaxID=2773457 RepID=UPI00280E36ED|nr:transketolase C-terminal domain-containing protein [Pelagicoccus enzymogenes]MDQ8199788.1 transketolase C-terminal domain-containing protein [Pelagicoccus enzymogenes]
MLITGDLGFGVFNQYREERASQFLNAGVAEQNMTQIATGMALEGYKVFTYSIGNFPTLRCLEQIRNDAAYHGANVNVVSIGGGFSYGQLGISHHATEDLAIMRSLPDVTSFAPCGLWETMEATKKIVEIPGTCFLRLDKDHGDDTPQLGEKFQVGKARIIRQGNDCSIIVCGGILSEAQKAAKVLSEAHGIETRIISMHTIQPFDRIAVVKAAEETGAVITLEEHTIHGGLGGAVAEALLDANVHPKRFLRIALEAGFSSIVGSQTYLRRQYNMDSDSIISRTLSLLEQ